MIFREMSFCTTTAESTVPGDCYWLSGKIQSAGFPRLPVSRLIFIPGCCTSENIFPECIYTALARFDLHRHTVGSAQNAPHDPLRCEACRQLRVKTLGQQSQQDMGLK